MTAANWASTAAASTAAGTSAGSVSIPTHSRPFLVSVPTAMFLCVYLSCTVSAARCGESEADGRIMSSSGSPQSGARTATTGAG